MLVGKADIVVMNATDSGVRRLGLTAEQLHEINPRAIGVQISASSKARALELILIARATILCCRRRPESRRVSAAAICRSCTASRLCVDYLTGYLGAFAAVTALQARVNGAAMNRGDWVDASLAAQRR
jgi:crotonobetainyl-CoA:carnitine CoA-transferase CaiB-like acyl-CoA transferase